MVNGSSSGFSEKLSILCDLGLQKWSRWSSKANRSDDLDVLWRPLPVPPAQRPHLACVRRGQPKDGKQRQPLVLREMRTHIQLERRKSDVVFQGMGLGSMLRRYSKKPQAAQPGKVGEVQAIFTSLRLTTNKRDRRRFAVRSAKKTFETTYGKS